MRLLLRLLLRLLRRLLLRLLLRLRLRLRLRLLLRLLLRRRSSSSLLLLRRRRLLSRRSRLKVPRRRVARSRRLSLPIEGSTARRWVLRMRDLVAWLARSPGRWQPTGRNDGPRGGRQRRSTGRPLGLV